MAACATESSPHEFRDLFGTERAVGAGEHGQVIEQVADQALLADPRAIPALIPPRLSLPLEPALEVTVEAGPKAAEIVDPEPGHAVSLAPKVVGIKPQQQRLALGQLPKSIDDLRSV